MPHVDEERAVVSGAEIVFTCSSCNTANETDAFRFRTVNTLYGLLTVWVTYETTVKCPACNATFRCSDEPADLALMSTQQLSNRFRLRIGFVEKFLVLAGWLLVCSGPVSLVMFLVALYQIPKAVRGWRLAAMIGSCLSAIMTAIMIFSVVFGPDQ